MANTDIKQHISIAERIKWNKVIDDLNIHVGAGGVENHPLGNGAVPGFSMNDFTNDFKTKLNGVEDGALNNPHPDTHPWTMITGLVKIANTGSWNDLNDIPDRVTEVINNQYDALTVSGGIRVTISTTAPSSPVNDKELWIDLSAMVLKIRVSGNWQIVGAAYR